MKKPIECDVESVKILVKAKVCLHNWLKLSDDFNEYMPTVINDIEMDAELKNSAFSDAISDSSNNYSDWPEQRRDELCLYFNIDGILTWPYDIVKNS